MAKHRRILFAVAIVLASIFATYSFVVKMSIAPIHANFIALSPNGTLVIDGAGTWLTFTTPLFLYCNGTVQVKSREPMNVTLIGAVGNIRLINGTVCLNSTCITLIRMFENYTLRIGNIMLFLFKSRTFEWYGTRLVLNMTFRPGTPSSFPVLEIVSKSSVEVMCNESR